MGKLFLIISVENLNGGVWRGIFGVVVREVFLKRCDLSRDVNVKEKIVEIRGGVLWV